MTNGKLPYWNCICSFSVVTSRVVPNFTYKGFVIFDILFLTVWPAWSPTHHYLLAVFHCCAPFIGYQEKYRVHFKICLLTYKALHAEQPVYLRYLIAISLPSRSLISNRGITLSIPRIKTNTGARAFSSCVPSLWNNLPLSVRSATFRRRLKTYLFDLAFFPVDTGVPNCLLLLRNDFNDFAFEHQSGCCATEPGYAGDIGAIKIRLID